MAKRKNITARTQERIHRASYDYSFLAGRARADGKDALANSFAEIAERLYRLAAEDAWWV